MILSKISNLIVNHKNPELTVSIKNPKVFSDDILCFILGQDNFDTAVIRSNIVTKYVRSAFRERMDEIYQKVLK